MIPANISIASRLQLVPHAMSSS